MADLVLRRIDQLVPFTEASGEHLIAVMLDGVGGYLTLAQVNALVTGDAPAGLNTLSEIADAFGDDPEFLTKVNGALAKRLRFDAAQTLTIPERQQAQTNLGLLVLLSDFVQGLRLINNSSDANNRIDIDIGTARRGALSVINEAVMTKRLDAAWASGTGNGGLDVNAKAPGLTYHVHSLVNNTTGVFDALFSLSATAPTVPSGWSRVQRLGPVLVDGSGNIRPVIQTGNDFLFNTLQASLPNDLSTNVSRAKALLTCTLPTGIRVHGIFQPFLFTSNGDSGSELLVADGANINIEKVVPTYASAGVKRGGQPFTEYTNTAGQIYAKLDITGTAGQPNTIKALGWRDYQIPRIGL